MYDMYPDAWPQVEERRPVPSRPERPQRRARKTHSVLPAVLTLPSSPAGETGR